MPFSTFNKALKNTFNNAFKAACLVTLTSFFQLGSVLYTAPVLGDSLNDTFTDTININQHSLSVQWSQSDETLQGANQSKEIHPETVSLQYGYQLNETWRGSTSIWSGSEKLPLSERLYLDRELSGFSVAISYQVSAESWWDFAWQMNKVDTRVDFQTFSEIFREQSETYDFISTWNYALTSDNFQLSPALSLGYQRSKFESQQDFLFRSDLRLREIQIEKSDGGYVSADLIASYFKVLTDSLIWIPSLALGWTEPLWGDVSSTSRIENMNASILRSQSGKRADDSSGSGYVSASFLFLLNDYFVDLSLTEPLNEDLSATTIAVLLGVDF